MSPHRSLSSVLTAHSPPFPSTLLRVTQEQALSLSLPTSPFSGRCELSRYLESLHHNFTVLLYMGTEIFFRRNLEMYYFHFQNHQIGLFFFQKPQLYILMCFVSNLTYTHYFQVMGMCRHLYSMNTKQINKKLSYKIQSQPF